MNENLYKTQEIKIINRNTLSITGIKKITNFDNLKYIIIMKHFSFNVQKTCF